VSSNWGGTPIQAWSSPKVLNQCSKTKMNRVIEEDGPHSKGPGDPSQLYNAMIVPLLPMRTLGAIWYQGEANVGDVPFYTCAFPVSLLKICSSS
jgi:sialate O-acetylesterase